MIPSPMDPEGWGVEMYRILVVLLLLALVVIEAVELITALSVR